MSTIEAVASRPVPSLALRIVLWVGQVLLRIRPRLTPLAACGLATIMVLAAGLHLARSEPFLMTAGLGAIAIFVAWGRFKRRRSRRVEAFARKPGEWGRIDWGPLRAHATVQPEQGRVGLRSPAALPRNFGQQGAAFPAAGRRWHA